MTKEANLAEALTNDTLYKVLRVCGSLPDVSVEVKKNHENNLWWPISIKDWRLRMVIAGWSSRVSYNMISTYQRVVSNVNDIGFKNLIELSESDLRNVVGSLGLFNARFEYLISISEFITKIKQINKNPLDIPNDELIELVANNVKWASYKVAQCAVLYAKGYHCGVFPVDSGMKDMLGPCIGMNLPKGALAHEVMRKSIEEILIGNKSLFNDLVQELGYSDLQIPENEPPVWWAHLVLIYFKRLYCNKHNPTTCPLRNHPDLGRYIGSMCARN